MRVGPVILVSLLVSNGQMAQSHANPITLTHGQDAKSTVMRAFGPTDPPYAFWRFCDEFPDQCAKRRTVDARLRPTDEQIDLLTKVNLGVNRSIEPVTDMELYRASDFWTMPRNGKGDCEDYALLKRHLLIQAGWPPSALLMTVVRDEKMEGHAVLTARTGKGDYILDNKTDDIKLWSRTPYRFVMRQSFLDPRAWVALDPAQSAPPAEIAVNRGTD
ncbi:MAG: transglutaminase-like cysteine peptidase [Hyphomicrobiaceae bacterium]